VRGSTVGSTVRTHKPISPPSESVEVLALGQHHKPQSWLVKMNTEGPTPLNYATPVKRVRWRWQWRLRLEVAALLATVHFGSGLLSVASDNRVHPAFLDIFLFPIFHLTEWLRIWHFPSLADIVAVAVGQSLLVGTLLAALCEGASRYFHPQTSPSDEMDS
jgi:hypothetical protein